MGDPKGFLKIKHRPGEYRPVCERVRDFLDVSKPRSAVKSQEQASRCMDCGTPFCHWGCPLGNYIPEWNDLMFRSQWRQAYDLLDATNNLPEITGRICPSLCEYSCVLGINDDPVTIRDNELDIIEYAFKSGWVIPKACQKPTGKKIAVIGSGPAGLSCADQLNRAGHDVVVFEKDDRIGGILRYGIPDFKLEKWILDRRINLLAKKGIEFRPGIGVGENYAAEKIIDEFDAVSVCCGCRLPRDLKIEGRQLSGIHFAMDYLIQSNRRLAKDKINESDLIDARDKKVVVIGGGDTGADCVGVAHRQGASCVVQIELMPQPPRCRGQDRPWPEYPMLLKTTTSHQEGGQRQWSVLTKKFLGDNGQVKKLLCVTVEFDTQMKEVAGSEFALDADLVILALGFLHPQHQGLLESLNLKLDSRGNVKTDDQYRSSLEKVFAAGDARRGQSLIVWAIAEGRRAAYNIDNYLMGTSDLPII